MPSGRVFLCYRKREGNKEKKEKRHKTMAVTTKALHNLKNESEKLAKHLPLIYPRITNDSKNAFQVTQRETAKCCEKKNHKKTVFTLFVVKLLRFLVWCFFCMPHFSHYLLRAIWLQIH